MLVVTLYYKSDCPQCDEARAILSRLHSAVPHRLVELDVNQDRSLADKLGKQAPVIQVGPYVLRWPFTEQEVRVSLGAAADRQKYLEKVGDRRYSGRVQRGHSVSGADRFSYWLSKRYMWIISLLLLVYTGLPILAPVFLKYNLPGPAKVIYAIYRPLCHQLGFRSVFLFGEQWYYPRALARVDGVLSYEQVTHQDDIDVLAARRYVGDEVVGYKTALCQRDLAIYGALFLFSMAFMLSGRRIKPIRWYLWVLLGLVPIGLDGVSQLPSIVSDLLPAWLPVRESIPPLRFLTGALFGLTTGWYLFPMVEETMAETARMLARKFQIVDQLDQNPEPEPDGLSK